MTDCALRKAGQDFCDECPHRSVRDECLRDGYVARSSLSPQPSFLQRVGVFTLSALALMTIPVVIRTILRLKVEGDVSNTVVAIVDFFSISFMVVVTVAALYGLYASVWNWKRAQAA